MQKEENKIQFTTEKKRLLVRVVFLLFFLGVFSVLPIFGANVVHAGAWDTAVGWFGDAASWVADNTVVAAFKYLLYSILWLVSWFTAVAVALFAYAVDPQWISGPSGMLNLQPVYDMWKFVRDIINIAFILGLLFIALAFIFQIDSYGNSKQVIKLIIAALLVNFSFPVARIIIDLANVPMYFFLQMILGDGNNASAALGSALGTSQLIDVLVPGSATEADVSTLLAGIIFLFLFTITILVLAMQLVIRMIALVILVILSPIGFVASGIPGMKKYGGQWWDNFLNYTFFGPAAIFMLLLATNFFAAISAADHYGSLKGVASTTSASNEGFIASMAMFFIPITMLWFAMGISKKFSIAGAEVATKYGKDFAKWTKSKVTAPVVSPVKSQYKAVKKGFEKGFDRGNLFGWEYGKLPGGKYLTGQHYDGATAGMTAGFIYGGTKGAKREKEKARDKEIHEKMKEYKEDNLSRDALEEKLTKGTHVEKTAAALSLAESKDGIKKRTHIYAAALQAVAGDYEKLEKVLKSGDDDATSMKPDEFDAVLNNRAVLDTYINSKLDEKDKAGLTPTQIDEKAKQKLIVDLGKQIKKVGGDIDALFEYQQGGGYDSDGKYMKKSLSDMSMYELGTLYTDHKFTMKDLSQQSALLKNSEFQKYAGSTFTHTEVTELAKLVAQNNKNPEVKVAVENMRKAVADRDKKPSILSTSPSTEKTVTEEIPPKKTIIDGRTTYEESEKGVLMPKEK